MGDLRTAVDMAWQPLDQAIISRLTDRMPHPIEARMAAQGDLPGIEIQNTEPQKAIEYSKQPSSRKSCRVVGGRGREVGGPDHPRVSSLKIGVETSQIILSLVWCSKLRLTTGFT
ncbi:hypothetical protein TNCV_1429571 [Trichonephila clavipes]|nr:hypothetical protein TNCV_1429571 [Trichonephila clavipes]